MININQLRMIGAGATADVYLFEKTKIIKLFHPDFNLESVEYESKMAQEISNTCIIAPKFYTTITIENRYGIIYDFVPGNLLVSLLIKGTLSQSIVLIKKMVTTQIVINTTINTKITNQIDRLSYLIKKSDIIKNYQETLLTGLNSIKQERFICHGDLHPGNIIVSGNQFITIDWMNCYAGNIEGDIVRSHLMLTTPYVPFEFSKSKKIFFAIYKQILATIYLRKYLSSTNIQKRSLKKWIPIIAAARLADNVPNEEKWLLRKIKKNIKYLTTASKNAPYQM